MTINLNNTSITDTKCSDMRILKTVNDNEYLIRSSLDIPSALSKTQRRRNVITIPAQSKNLLTEHSYEIVKRLGNVLVGRTD